ncbi:hypothetical protein CJ030_MR1G019926 [Morella rubra]|uniref:RING-type domain-containing protein n=1 Tax=Morella rubra TaxID=262757 RepID=A0A6A1WKC7_9ROSI|nr:hypothetical protein CJ030_MR1G019926 [Morella rubra]
MEAPEHGQHEHAPSSSAASTSTDGPSSSSPSTSQVQEEEVVVVENEPRENGSNDHRQQHHHRHMLLNHHRRWQRQQALSYRLNISINDAASTEMRDDVWSCLVVLVTFWFLAASMTLIFGFYGSVNTLLGPNSSRLIQTNPFFVQSLEVEQFDEPKAGPILYGFYKPPPLDVEISWTETHNAFEWVYFLNEGSRVDISYNVKSPSPSPLSLVIAQGRESLYEWREDPSYPNTTLSWNIIYGSGKIQQNISNSGNYYVAVGNLHDEEVEVELKLMLNALLYNTTQAYYKCPLSNHVCTFKLFLLRRNFAVLTSPVPKEGTDDNWFVRLSYGPRWITYFAGSGYFGLHLYPYSKKGMSVFIFTTSLHAGAMTILLLLTFRYSNTFQNTAEGRTGSQAGEVGTERDPLLLRKDDDVASWGSSYDSVSPEEDEMEQQHETEGQQHITEGENTNNPSRLCVICFDAPRDCFFLPCGHCAACFTCGTRLQQFQYLSPSHYPDPDFVTERHHRMDQREDWTTAARPRLKRKLEAAEFEDQNLGGRQLLAFEGQSNDGTVSHFSPTTTSQTAIPLPDYPHFPSGSLSIPPPPMDHHDGKTTTETRSLKRKLDPESEDQHEERKVLVVEHRNKDGNGNHIQITYFARQYRAVKY